MFGSLPKTAVHAVPCWQPAAKEPVVRLSCKLLPKITFKDVMHLLVRMLSESDFWLYTEDLCGTMAMEPMALDMSFKSHNWLRYDEALRATGGL